MIGPPMPNVKSHCLSSLPGVVRPALAAPGCSCCPTMPLAHAGQIRRAFERVAAALRDDAERGAADFGFTQPAGGRRHHFLRVRDVGDVGRDAAAAESRARVQAVHLHAAFVVAPARAAEHRHLRRDLDVRRAAADGDDAGNQAAPSRPTTAPWEWTVSTSLLIVVCRLMLCTSTIGDAPVTVIVSVTPPTVEVGVDLSR